LQLLADDGRNACGPFPVATRADIRLARRLGNPDRDPTCRFGDVGLGTYGLETEVSAKQTKAWGTPEYGPVGALAFRPESGEAAIGEANGRFELVLHGGDGGRDGRLRPTAGGLRLSNGDLKELLAHVRAAGGDLICECVAGEPACPSAELDLAGKTASLPADAPGFGGVAAPARAALSVLSRGISRRRLLQGGVAAMVGSVAGLGPARFAWADATAAPLVVAQLAYGPVTFDNGQVYDVIPVVPFDSGEEVIPDVIAVPGTTVIVPSGGSGGAVLLGGGNQARAGGGQPRYVAPQIRPQPRRVAPTRRQPGSLPAPYVSVRDQALDRSLKVISQSRGPAAVGNVKGLVTLSGAAKMRGAFDINTQGAKDPLKEASDMSAALGPGFVVVYENPDPVSKTQTNTIFYSNGTSKIMTGKTGSGEFMATAPHIHVQPDASLFAKGS
jgi:hypothetical protein